MAFGLAAVLSTAPAARADVDIDIKINLGYGGFYGKNVTCLRAEQIVKRRFNAVSRRNCKGANYDFNGKRNGKWYHVRVSKATGRISSVVRFFP
jgi:hypothetical protein